MFNVVDKKAYEVLPNCKLIEMIETVYGILDDSNGFPKFLLYERGQWVYRSAKHYIPYDIAMQK